MDWNKLRVFHNVSLAGSFTKATEALHISPSAISRQISLLESEIGTQLFSRTAQGLILTKAGKKLDNIVTNVLAKITKIEATIAENKTLPRGHIKVATTVAFGSTWLAPKLQSFLDLFPDIRISLLLKDEKIDFNSYEASIGIIPQPMENSAITQLASITYKSRFYASSQYLKAHGTPKTLQDLKNHIVIILKKESPYLLDELSKNTTSDKPYIAINTSQGVYEAVKSGLGIASLPKYIIGNDPDIKEILHDYPGDTLSQHIVYPSHLASVKHIKVFVDFLVTKMKQEEF